MAHPIRSVVACKAVITGNVVAPGQDMVQDDPQDTGLPAGGPGIEAGGRVVLGTATSADVNVLDANGTVLLTSTTVGVGNLDIEPDAHGVMMPLKVIVANISNAAHTLTVYWFVKK